MKWYRKSSLHLQGQNEKEIWSREQGEDTEDFSVEIDMGKKTNLLKLKSNIIDSIKSKLDYYSETRLKLYSGPTDYVDKCPVTGVDTESCIDVANIYGAKYVQTPDTGHVFVKNRPTKKSISDFYLNDITYAATYTDKEKAEFRLNSIAVPWRDWMIKKYEIQFGVKPKKVLDVGSGAGHFVEACRRAGIEADGIELSESSRDFSKKVWGIDLDGRDFTEVYEEYAGYDVVTFWGLLEHTPNPKKILNSATKIISKSDGGMVISKLPRWDSLSSASQRLNPETIIRHIDPMGHIMLFSDSSAAELYYQCDLKPVNAWYYGMDVYESLMQIGNLTKDYNHFLNTGELQMNLQQFIDEARYSDGLTLVGVKR